MQVNWYSELDTPERWRVLIGDVCRLHCGRIRKHGPELASDSRRRVDGFLPLALQPLLFGEYFFWRHKGDDILEKLGSIEDGFTSGICDHAAGVATRSVCSELASGLALLFTGSVLHVL